MLTTTIHDLSATEIPHCWLHPDTEPERLWVKDGFDYLCCPECGLIWVNPQLTDESVAQIYAAEFRSKKSRQPQYPGKRNFKEGLRLIAPAWSENARLLDVGTFTGHFLVAARETGWNQPEGTEISGSAAQFARDAYNLTIHEGDLLDLPLQEASYDAITLSDVIEHVSNPLATIRQIHKLLCADGILYMHTPHAGSLPRRYYGAEWSVFFPWHRTIFSVPAMRQMLEANGFHVTLLRSVGILPIGRHSAWQRYLSTRDSSSTEETAERSPAKQRVYDILRPIWLSAKRASELPFIPLSAVGIELGTRLVVCAKKRER